MNTYSRRGGDPLILANFLQLREYDQIMRKLLGIFTLISLLTSTSAFAASPASQYQAAQKSVKYQILQPASTGDLLLRSFQMQSCGATSPKWLAAIYGETRSVQFLETDSAVNCSNPGLGKKVATANINGNVATIVAFCDPANPAQWKSCKTSDIHNFGGYAMWKVPATKKLRGTEVEVLVSGLTYADLLKMARGMKPVGA